MFGLGATELLVIVFLVLVLFGAGKLPKVMEDLGKGVNAFKSGMNEAEGQEKNAPKKVKSRKNAK